jgi:hypothetical protein
LTLNGGDVSCVLEAQNGDSVTIGAESVMSTSMVLPTQVGGGLQLEQAIVRYTWDGEVGTGMMERSTAGGNLD